MRENWPKRRTTPRCCSPISWKLENSTSSTTAATTQRTMPPSNRSFSGRAIRPSHHHCHRRATERPASIVLGALSALVAAGCIPGHARSIKMWAAARALPAAPAVKPLLIIQDGADWQDRRGQRGKVAFSSKSGNADGPHHPFTAFRIENDDAGYRSGLAQLKVEDLSPGQVLIRASWSSVNYKDALAGTGKGKILRRFRWWGHRRSRHRGRQHRSGMA